MIFLYARRHYRIIVLFCVFIIIFAMVFSLYNLELEAIMYAALLCLCLGLLAFGLGFLRYWKKHKTLKSLMKNLDLGIAGLPSPSGIVEGDYQAMLQELYARNLKIVSETDSARRDAEDYYTLWAHQIKTPLAAMRLLLTEEREENKLLMVELFKTEQYVDAVLQYVRLSSESQDLLLKTCALDDIIRGSLRKYARLFSLKKLEFSFEETRLNVLTDEKWIAFVIEQIFSNSLKYTHSGKISIFSEGEALIIQDTGIGIRAEDLPRVCEKGYTGANGRADKRSTGIGLFLCKSILTRLGHGIEISSVVGQGTKVKIDLKREKIIVE